MDTSFTKERKLVNYKINEFLIFLKIKTNINSKENKENKTLEEELPSMDLIIFLFYLMMYRHKEMPFVIQLPDENKK